MRARQAMAKNWKENNTFRRKVLKRKENERKLDRDMFLLYTTVVDKRERERKGRVRQIGKDPEFLLSSAVFARSTLSINTHMHTYI